MALPLPNTTEVQIVRLTKALYNAAPGNTYLTAFTESAGTTDAGMTTFANWFAGTVSADAATLASTVVTNIGLTGAAATAGTAYLTAQFAANPGNYGRVILDAMNALATLTSDATYGTAASAVNDSVATAYSYSITTTNTSTNLATLQAADEPSAVTGQSFTLTTAADTKTGTSGNDTFDGSLSGTSMTFGAADSIDGGAGTDTLTVSMNAAGTYQAAALKNVESVTVIDSAGATLSLLGATGVESVTSMGSTAATTVSNIAATSTKLGVSNSAVGATFTFAASAVSGTADEATLTLSGQTAGTDVIAGVETLNIVSSGAANAVTALTTAAATKFVITGDQTLNLGTVGATVLTVDANAATAGVTFTSDQATASTITGGSGNDAITMTGTNAVNDTINAGAGNDTITFAANLATTDTVDGGAGTDTLVLTTALATGYTAPATATITNFETLKLSNALAGGLTTANVQAGITTLDLNAGSGAQAVVMEAGAQTVKIGAANTGTLTVTDTGSATTDSLTVTNTGAAISIFGAAAGGLTVSGYETVTINGSGTGAATTQAATTISVTADAGGTATLNLTGSNTFTTTGAITAAVVDASGLTGSAILDMGAAAASGLTSITGSANGDDLRGDASSSIDGGAGNDSITGGSGNDTLVGGAGVDTITSGAGNDSISAGAGNDTIVMAADYATGDTIDGGDDTDTLSMTTANATTVAGYSISAITALNAALNNVERLTFTDAFNVGSAFDMARIDSINHITLGEFITGAEELSGLANNTTVVVTANTANDTSALTLTLADSTGSTDTLNYTMTQAATDDYGSLVVSGVETLNITANEATADATVRVATLGLTITTATAGTTVNIGGTETVTIDTAIAAQTITSTTTGAFIMTNATGSGLSQTITTGAGNDSIYGGGGVDTISTGAGTDSIVGGTGADVITSGEGADTIVGGSGNDTITLTETSATVDDVILDYSESGTYADRLVGFTTATGGDEIQIDLSALEALGAAGGVNASSATNFVSGLDANGDAANTNAGGVEVLTGAETAGAGDNVFVISGATFSATTEVEDALESGGAYQLGISTTDADVIQYDQFLVAYTDGTDAHLAVATVTTDAGVGGVFAAGNLTVKDLVVIVGVSSLGATTFANDNFEYVS